MAYIFVGNTQKKLNLTANKIYKELPTDKIKELEEKGYSLISQLFVKAEKLDNARNDLKKRGTILNEALKQLNNIGG